MAQNDSHGQLTAQVDLGQIQKNGFVLDHSVYGSGRLGRLYPVHWSEVSAGDTLDIDTNIGVQFEPLAVPTLNNMHVKQEQFYIPKNVVWENWDKFLSNGEGNDYNGMVPTITLRDCVNRLASGLLYHPSSVLDGFGILSPLRLPVSCQSDYFLTKADFEEYRSRFETQYKNSSFYTICRTYGMLDLIDHIPSAVTMMCEYMETLFAAETGALRITFGKRMEYSAFIESAEHDFVVTNKYLSKLYNGTGDSILKDSDGSIFVLTDECIAICKYMYEIIKPFVGYGSYLDMLEYDILTFTDFLGLCIKSLTYSYTSSSGLTKYQFGLSSSVIEHITAVGREVLTLRSLYSIWYNNYRDQLIETSAYEPQTGDTVSTNELVALLMPRVRCWQKDTFTTALANAGTANGIVPVTGGAWISRLYNDDMKNAHEIEDSMKDVYKIGFVDNGQELKIPVGFIQGLTAIDETKENVSYFSLTMLDAAKRAQKFLQKALYYGNRIQDFMYVHFGVKHLDARLRLPEWLASKTDMVKLNVVTNNTTIESEGTIAGDRSAVAFGEQYGDHIHRYCEEHGCIIGLMSIIPDVAYATGVSREHSRIDQFDFPFPEFATLGMDAVYDTELMQRSITNEVNGQEMYSVVFGYQGRYYDRKCRQSKEHGELLDSMDMYTFSRRFYPYKEDTMPKLNERFIHCHPKLDMFVVDNDLSDYFRFDVFNKVRASLQLPLYSIYL